MGQSLSLPCVAPAVSESVRGKLESNNGGRGMGNTRRPSPQGTSSSKAQPLDRPRTHDDFTTSDGLPSFFRLLSLSHISELHGAALAELRPKLIAVTSSSISSGASSDATTLLLDAICASSSQASELWQGCVWFLQSTYSTKLQDLSRFQEEAARFVRRLLQEEPMLGSELATLCGMLVTGTSGSALYSLKNGHPLQLHSCYLRSKDGLAEPSVVVVGLSFRWTPIEPVPRSPVVAHSPYVDPSLHSPSAASIFHGFASASGGSTLEGLKSGGLNREYRHEDLLRGFSLLSAVPCIVTLIELPELVTRDSPGLRSYQPTEQSNFGIPSNRQHELHTSDIFLAMRDSLRSAGSGRNGSSLMQTGKVLFQNEGSCMYYGNVTEMLGVANVLQQLFCHDLDLVGDMLSNVLRGQAWMQVVSVPATCSAALLEQPVSPILNQQWEAETRLMHGEEIPLKKAPQGPTSPLPPMPINSPAPPMPNAAGAPSSPPGSELATLAPSSFATQYAPSPRRSLQSLTSSSVSPALLGSLATRRSIQAAGTATPIVAHVMGHVYTNIIKIADLSQAFDKRRGASLPVAGRGTRSALSSPHGPALALRMMGGSGIGTILQPVRSATPQATGMRKAASTSTLSSLGWKKPNSSTMPRNVSSTHLPTSEKSEACWPHNTVCLTEEMGPYFAGGHPGKGGGLPVGSENTVPRSGGASGTSGGNNRICLDPSLLGNSNRQHDPEGDSGFMASAVTISPTGPLETTILSSPSVDDILDSFRLNPDSCGIKAINASTVEVASGRESGNSTAASLLSITNSAAPTAGPPMIHTVPHAAAAVRPLPILQAIAEQCNEVFLSSPTVELGESPRLPLRVDADGSVPPRSVSGSGVGGKPSSLLSWEEDRRASFPLHGRDVANAGSGAGAATTGMSTPLPISDSTSTSAGSATTLTTASSNITQISLGYQLTSISDLLSIGDLKAAAGPIGFPSMEDLRRAELAAEGLAQSIAAYEDTEDNMGQPPQVKDTGGHPSFTPIPSQLHDAQSRQSGRPASFTTTGSEGYPFLGLPTYLQHMLNATPALVENHQLMPVKVSLASDEQMPSCFSANAISLQAASMLEQSSYSTPKAFPANIRASAAASSLSQAIATGPSSTPDPLHPSDFFTTSISGADTRGLSSSASQLNQLSTASVLQSSSFVAVGNSPKRFGSPPLKIETTSPKRLVRQSLQIDWRGAAMDTKVVATGRANFSGPTVQPSPRVMSMLMAAQNKEQGDSCTTPRRLSVQETRMKSTDSPSGRSKGSNPGNDSFKSASYSCPPDRNAHLHSSLYDSTPSDVKTARMASGPGVYNGGPPVHRSFSRDREVASEGRDSLSSVQEEVTPCFASITNGSLARSSGATAVTLSQEHSGGKFPFQSIAEEPEGSPVRRRRRPAADRSFYVFKGGPTLTDQKRPRSTGSAPSSTATTSSSSAALLPHLQAAFGSSVCSASQILRQSAGGLPPREGNPDAAVQSWHDVAALPVKDPVTGKDVLLLMQTDITARAELEKQMAALTESQLTMLEQMFPRHVLEFMVGSGSGPSRAMGHLATSHNNVTILFMDIVGFTSMSKEVAPEKVMQFLNHLFTLFDELVDNYEVYKVETAGDCYIVAGGLMRYDDEGFLALDPDPDARSGAHKAMEFAKAMLRCAKTVNMPHNNEPTKVRVGMHTGPVVTGLIGMKLPKFSVFGDTMNTASRMESTCTQGCVQVSEDTMPLLSDQHTFVPTGGVEVKGKGMMQTFIWTPEKNPSENYSSPKNLEQDANALLMCSQHRASHSTRSSPCSALLLSCTSLLSTVHDPSANERNSSATGSLSSLSNQQHSGPPSSYNLDQHLASFPAASNPPAGSFSPASHVGRVSAGEDGSAMSGLKPMRMGSVPTIPSAFAILGLPSENSPTCDASQPHMSPCMEVGSGGSLTDPLCRGSTGGSRERRRAAPSLVHLAAAASAAVRGQGPNQHYVSPNARKNAAGMLSSEFSQQAMQMATRKTAASADVGGSSSRSINLHSGHSGPSGSRSSIEEPNLPSVSDLIELGKSNSLHGEAAAPLMSLLLRGAANFQATRMSASEASNSPNVSPWRTSNLSSGSAQQQQQQEGNEQQQLQQLLDQQQQQVQQQLQYHQLQQQQQLHEMNQQHQQQQRQLLDQQRQQLQQQQERQQQQQQEQQLEVNQQQQSKQ